MLSDFKCGTVTYATSQFFIFLISSEPHFWRLWLEAVSQQKCGSARAETRVRGESMSGTGLGLASTKRDCWQLGLSGKLCKRWFLIKDCAKWGLWTVRPSQSLEPALLESSILDTELYKKELEAETVTQSPAPDVKAIPQRKVLCTKTVDHMFVLHRLYTELWKSLNKVLLHIPSA